MPFSFTSNPVRPPLFRAPKGFFSAFRWAISGSMLSLPFIAFDVATAERGEKLPTLAGDVSSLLSYPALTATFAAGLTLVPGIGPAAAIALATVLAIYPDNKINEGINRGFRTFSQFGTQVRHLEFGGHYQDSLTAQSERMNAIQEMNAAFQTSRRYLGQEARIFHR